MTPGGPRLPVIAVTGFMATGKTAVGRALAILLGLDFVDTDEAIEKASGLTVAEIFETHGEKRFREMEAALCRELVGRPGVVIATGGGTLIDRSNFELFAGKAQIALLTASVDTLCERLGEDVTRPLLGGRADETVRDRIVDLLERRKPAYDRIALRVDTTGRAAQQSAERVAAALDLPAVSTTVDFAGGEEDRAGGERPLGRHGACRIDVGRGILSNLGARLRTLGLARRVFFLMPRALQDLYRGQIEASMERESIPCDFIDVEDGDAAKNLEQVRNLIDALAQRGATRDSTVVPVGGGVTGDIGGFVASIYMRGVPLVHVPTTLLAQVDSSIGGKVGVNHSAAKNLIGSFYQPHGVVNDPCTLRSLPMQEMSNGMAEVVKSALIGSTRFFERLEKATGVDASSRLRDIDFVEHCVTESVAVKRRIVNEDPFERDARRTLNLGHTVGHAIEASAGYEGISHGQAVSMGLVAALRIGVRRGDTEKDLLDRVSRLLEWCGLPVALERVDRDRLAGSMKLDKKVRDGRLHFVLVERPGRVKIVDDVTVEDVMYAIEER